MSERSLVCVIAMLLAGCTSFVPPVAETASISAPLTPVPSATSPATPRPSATTSETATATASASPTPTTTPADGLERLELDATGCPGGVALDWSPATHPAFHHYTALRSLDAEVRPDYPPIAPAVDWGDSYATDRFVTSAVDATLIPSGALFSYRVMAYDDRNAALAASEVRRTRPAAIVELGAMTLEPGADGGTRIDWRLFGGAPGCFSAYRVFIGPAGATPSTMLTAITRQSTTELETGALHAGETYAVRVEVVRTMTLGGFVVAETETASYTAP